MKTEKNKNHPCCAGVIPILILLLSLPRPAAAQAGRFSPTGSASNARTVHTATLLPNGKVLVAGGFNPPSPTWASAEVYDPNTGLFSSTGSLITARRGHTATLLPNGKVLVAGGRVPPNYFASAEIYDPGSGLFSATGSMSVGRAFFTATLLSNGKVLVAGGVNSATAIASAEIYDPDTGLFSPTGSMSTPRETPTATLLPDGRVLIAGGDNGTTTATASAEIYDPDTGKFSANGSMSTARTEHTATLLPPSTVRPNGKVLIAGGDGSPNGGPPFFASAELYDPGTGTFSPTGSLITGRWLHTATLLPAYELRPHGKVLIAGGQAASVLASAELYDPDTGKFSPTGSLSTPRRQHTATLLPNGGVLVAAGDNGIAGAFASAELYALPPTYTITDLGTLTGGTFSQASFLRDDGFVAGVGAAPDGTQHAVVWYNGQIGDLTPGVSGPNSGAFGINERGQVNGQAETTILDPDGEDFCAYGTNLICLPFLWQNGVMTTLPTLGGKNATVGQINNRGQVIGVAENSTKDKNCVSPQVLDYEAVIWGPQPGQIQQLSPLPGDTVGMALWINDSGQAVGASGSCANSALPPLAYGPHAVLWETDGSVTDLGNLGGTAVNIGLSINNQGQVVGASSLTADSTPFLSTDAFLWTRGTGMRDLGTLPGDVASGGQGINDRGEVVGLSVDASGNPRGFLYQNGVMYDLNTLIPANSPLFVLDALTINSGGEIAGVGVTRDGDMHAFLATPSSGEDTSGSFTSASQNVTSAMALSEDVRKTLQQRLRSGQFAGRARLMGLR
jgi:probable HAF family extracellular repeat protein